MARTGTARLSHHRVLMVKHGIRAFLVFSFVIPTGAVALAQSRTAALNVQVQVQPSCAISVAPGEAAVRASLSCAGNPQSKLRARVDDGPVSPVRLNAAGRARSTAEVVVSGSSDSRVLTIQF